MIRYTHSIFFILFFAVVSAQCNKSEKPIIISPEVIILKNGFLLDGKSSYPVENDLIVIENGFIKYLGQDSDFVISEDSRLIDLSGKTILPGIINAHVHDGYNALNLKE